jgi:hypothetical protein
LGGCCENGLREDAGEAVQAASREATAQVVEVVSGVGGRNSPEKPHRNPAAMRATQSGKIDGAARAGEQTGRTAMGRRLSCRVKGEEKCVVRVRARLILFAMFLNNTNLLFIFRNSTRLKKINFVTRSVIS